MESNDKLPGKISINSVNCSHEPDYVSIEIRDDISNIPFLNVKISYEEFAKVVTGSGHRPCDLSFFGMKNIGKVYEHKEEIINFGDDNRSPSDAMIRKKIAEYEVDGWRGRDGDAKNHHNWVRSIQSREANTYPNTYRIHFGRYVKRGKKK